MNVIDSNKLEHDAARKPLRTFSRNALAALCFAAVSAPVSATDYTSTVKTDLQAGDTVTTTVPGSYNPTVQGYGLYAEDVSLTAYGSNTIKTSGDSAYGAYASVINASGGLTFKAGSTITTGGGQAYGVYVHGGGTGNSSLDMDGITIITTGQFGYGIVVLRDGSGTATVTLKDTTVTTGGASASGMYFVDANSTMTGNTKISTSGQGAQGIFQQGGTADISGILTVATTGLGADGIDLDTAATLTVGAGTVTTHNDNAAAIYITGGSSATLTGTKLATHGNTAPGLRMSDLASTTGQTNAFTGTGVTISTSGAGSNAIQFEAPNGLSNINNVTFDATSKLSTTGAGSHIVSVQQGAVQTIDTAAGPGVLVLPSTGSNISVTGPGSALVNVTDAGSQVTIKGGGLPAGVRFGPDAWGVIAESDGKAVFTVGATTQGYSLWARAGAGGTGTITFEDTSTAAGSRVRVDAGGVFDLTASTLGNFPVASLEGDGGNVHLGANTLVLNGAATTQYDGVIDGTGGLTRDGNGTTILKGDNQYTGPTLVTGKLVVDGSIRSATTVAASGTLGGGGTVFGDVTSAGIVAPGDGNSLGALTVAGNYVGQPGARLAVAAVLGPTTATSSADRLIIDGGTASGSTSVVPATLSGPGGLTDGLGIPVVVTQNGGTTGTGAFTLGGPVAAGPYEYQLFRSGDGATGEQTQGWYLRSHCTTDCGGNGGDGGGPIPLYRPEAAIYAAAPGMARQLGMTLLGTFHERAGDQSLLRGSGTVSGAWGRWIGQKTEMSHGGPLSPKFEGTTNGLQVGLDLYGFDQPGYGSDRFGIFGGYARSLGDIDGFALGRQGYKAGKMDLSGYSIGGTWTHVGTGGWYIDAVLMGTRYDGDPRSHRGQSAKVKGYGLTASLESGLPLALGRGLTIEPQAQIVWQYLNLDNTRDRFATIAYDTPSTLAGRLGLRVSGAFQAGGAVLKPYVTANIWQEFAGSDKTIFSGTAMRSGGGNATSAELTGGIATQVTNAVGLWGDVSYLKDISGPDRQAWRGNVGVRVTW